MRSAHYFMRQDYQEYREYGSLGQPQRIDVGTSHDESGVASRANLPRRPQPERAPEQGIRDVQYRKETWKMSNPKPFCMIKHQSGCAEAR
jgi:hypothetical protein